jgi:drug/metabolite transporter (DMT)-like permease
LSEAALAAARPGQPRRWLLYAVVTTLTWGVWGALIELPEKAGFPPTLGYSVWALTMIPCACVVLAMAGWRVARDRRALLLGSAAGFLGAGGQIILFEALRTGPAYVVFPVVSLYPALTILLSVLRLGETAARRHWAGILLALPAIALLSWTGQSDTRVTGYTWLLLALGVFVMWGVQAYVMKVGNDAMSAESLFAYMTVTALALIPVAVAMTDFSKPINWGLRGAWLAAAVHLLNSVGALALVYALRYGKAIIVVPLTALAPVITIMLSLAIYSRVPLPAQTIGLVLAAVAIYLMAE